MLQQVFCEYPATPEKSCFKPCRDFRARIRPGALTPWIADRVRLVLSSLALKIKRLLPAPAETGVFPIAVNQYVTDL